MRGPLNVEQLKLGRWRSRCKREPKANVLEILGCVGNTDIADARRNFENENLSSYKKTNSLFVRSHQPPTHRHFISFHHYRTLLVSRKPTSHFILIFRADQNVRRGRKLWIPGRDQPVVGLDHQ